MASVNLDRIYYLPSGATTLQTVASATNWTLTSESDTWQVGDAITTSGPANLTLYYMGYADDGSLVLNWTSSFDSTTYYFTDDQTLLGQAMPSYSAAAVTVCFAAGTLITTTTGEVNVKDLKAGDILRTAVKWIGRQTLATVFADAARVCPVRISAGALAENVPSRDLLVTGDHGMVFDEAIVHASALVNGTTITRLAKSDLPPVVTNYHIETEGHAVVIADGAPAEIFIDNTGLEAFDNFAEYVEMYGAEQDDIEPLGLPRAKSAREVPSAIKARIGARTPRLASVA